MRILIGLVVIFGDIIVAKAVMISRHAAAAHGHAAQGAGRMYAVAAIAAVISIIIFAVLLRGKPVKPAQRPVSRYSSLGGPR